MPPRRSLTEGLKHTPPAVDPEQEKAFVSGGKPAKEHDRPVTPPTPSIPARVQLSTRIRGDYAAALKRASLERQLGGIEPHTMIDILEQAIEPWLRRNDYLT